MMQQSGRPAGWIVFNVRSGEVRADGRLLNLTGGERRLLALLMRHAGNVVQRVMIEEHFSVFGREICGNAVEAHVSRLRKTLDERPCGVSIETVRGIGYALREVSV